MRKRVLLLSELWVSCSDLYYNKHSSTNDLRFSKLSGYAIKCLLTVCLDWMGKYSAVNFDREPCYTWSVGLYLKLNVFPIQSSFIKYILLVTVKIANCYYFIWQTHSHLNSLMVQIVLWLDLRQGMLIIDKIDRFYYSSSFNTVTTDGF